MIHLVRGSRRSGEQPNRSRIPFFGLLGIVVSQIQGVMIPRGDARIRLGALATTLEMPAALRFSTLRVITLKVIAWNFELLNSPKPQGSA